MFNLTKILNLTNSLEMAENEPSNWTATTIMPQFGTTISDEKKWGYVMLATLLGIAAFATGILYLFTNCCCKLGTASELSAVTNNQLSTVEATYPEFLAPPPSYESLDLIDASEIANFATPPPSYESLYPKEPWLNCQNVSNLKHVAETVINLVNSEESIPSCTYL